MPDKKFKTCIINGYEQYAIISHESQMTELQTERFPGSLLSFIDVDMDTISPMFSELDAGFKRLSAGQTSETRSELLHILDTLAEQHIYFVLFQQECGMFEVASGHQLMDYLTAYRFGAIEWEIVPGTTCERVVLGEVDTTTPEYQQFEHRLYARVLKRMGFDEFLVPDPQ